MPRRRRAQSPKASTQRKRGRGAERGLYSTVHPQAELREGGQQLRHNNQREKETGGAEPRLCWYQPHLPTLEPYDSINKQRFRQEVEAMPPTARTGQVSPKTGDRLRVRGSPTAKLTPVDGIWGEAEGRGGVRDERSASDGSGLRTRGGRAPYLRR